MKPFLKNKALILIVISTEERQGSIESAVREHTQRSEVVPIAHEEEKRTAGDAELLPLWRWFAF